LNTQTSQRSTARLCGTALYCVTLLHGCGNLSLEEVATSCASGISENPGASCSASIVQGTITTADNRPFELTSEGQRLSISPGKMTITVVERAHHRSVLLWIESGPGRLLTKVQPEEVANHSFQIPGASRGLSADIAGTWADQIEGQLDRSGSGACTYSGYCTQTFADTTCDKDGKNCSTRHESRYGYYSDCSGTWATRDSIEIVRRAYTFDFINPHDHAQRLGHFEGQTARAERVIASVPIGKCHL
jgi:hypothetical protein